MEPTPEEQRIMAAADWAAEHHPFRKRAPVLVGGLFLMLVFGAFTSSGADRLLFGGMAACMAAVAAPILAEGNPLLEGPARLFKFLVGLALFLGGLGIIGVGIVLIKAGSFGILAGMVLIPIGMTGAMMGWTTLSAKVSTDD